MPAIPEINFSTDLQTLKFLKNQNDQGLDKLLNQTSKQEETRKMKQEMFRSNQMLCEEKSSNNKGVKNFKLDQDKFNNSEFIDSGNKLEKIKLDKRSQMRDYRMQLELQKMC